jgi:DeoR/GlpR family transcriptional regulator of sugar metabolism
MPPARYGVEIERSMQALFASLSERDRRLYAATEVLKLGHGGICYLAGLFGCSERTIRRGIAELARLPEPPNGRVRRKGGEASVA